MPMYEKGSVRAEPRSKQQERMKKIMKKFLSSLLALTMILSLVIVPANATDNDAYTVTGSLSISPSTTTVVSGTNSTTLTASQNFTVVKNATSNPGTVATTLENPTILYSWSGTGVIDSKTSTLTLTNLTTTSASETKPYTCTVTIKDGDTLVATREATATITVTNGQKAFEDATNKTVTYQGRTYTVPVGANPSVTIDTFGDEAIDNLTAKVGGTDTTITKTADNTFTLKSVDNAYSVTLTTTPSKVTGQTLTIDKGASVTLYEGQQIELTATYSRANGNKNVSYAWKSNPDATFRNDTSAKAIFKAPTSVSSDTNYTVTCTVKEGDTTAKTANITITVKDDPYSPNRNGESSSKTIATNGLTNYCTFSAPILYSSTASTHSISYGTSGFDIAWAVERGSALVKTEKQSNGSCKVTALTAARSGSATITATITYMGKQYPALEYTIDISALDAELSSIVNGDSDSYRQSDIQDKLADAIKK